MGLTDIENAISIAAAAPIVFLLSRCLLGPTQTSNVLLKWTQLQLTLLTRGMDATTVQVEIYVILDDVPLLGISASERIDPTVLASSPNGLAVLVRQQ